MDAGDGTAAGRGVVAYGSADAVLEFRWGLDVRASQARPTHPSSSEVRGRLSGSPLQRQGRSAECQEQEDHHPAPQRVRCESSSGQRGPASLSVFSWRCQFRTSQPSSSHHGVGCFLLGCSVGATGEARVRAPGAEGGTSSTHSHLVSHPGAYPRHARTHAPPTHPRLASLQAARVHMACPLSRPLNF